MVFGSHVLFEIYRIFKCNDNNTDLIIVKRCSGLKSLPPVVVAC